VGIGETGIGETGIGETGIGEAVISGGVNRRILRRGGHRQTRPVTVEQNQWQGLPVRQADPPRAQRHRMPSHEDRLASSRDREASTVSLVAIDRLTR
jgi:hypothetical protein